MTTNRTPEPNHRKGRLGLYIHVPFCERKCSYCGFLSYTGRKGADLDAYTDALCREIRLLAADFNPGGAKTVDTVFFGGGTPSLLPSSDIAKILEHIRAHFPVDAGLEATLEANPGTLSPAFLAQIRQSGINRLSLGIQSFEDSVLRTLGRIHDSRQALEAVAMTRAAGFDNLSMDLMFGLPGQTLQQWRRTLETAAALEPEHLSAYALQLEEGTPLYRDYRAEKVLRISSTLERNMFHQAAEMLGSRGFERYEISNYCRPGKACRHNLKYWNMEEFLGAGPGASSYASGRRWKNMDDLDRWSEALSLERLAVDKNSLLYESESDRAGTFVFTGLRKAEGIRYEDFSRLTGQDFFDFYKAGRSLIDRFVKRGHLLEITGANAGIRLTEAGIDHSNEIMSEFV